MGKAAGVGDGDGDVDGAGVGVADRVTVEGEETAVYVSGEGKGPGVLEAGATKRDPVRGLLPSDGKPYRYYQRLYIDQMPGSFWS